VSTELWIGPADHDAPTRFKRGFLIGLAVGTLGWLALAVAVFTAYRGV
jgi:hypothetical protein